MVHPSSNNNLRPASSLSVGRPSSSASVRSLSRLSHHRPTNARAQARTKLIPLAQTLVKQVTGFDDNHDVDDASAYQESVDFVVKNLEATTLNKAALRMDMNFIGQTIQGHALKARLGLKDELGNAFEKCFKDIKVHMETRRNDLDDEIQASSLDTTVSRIPDHLQLLLALSNAPTAATEVHASLYLHNRANPIALPDRLTWEAIVAEEPFEGEHWEGVYGLPPGFVRRSEPQDGKWFYDKEKERDRIDFDSRWSTPSLSPLNSDDLELDEEQERELAEQGRMLYEPSMEEVEDIDLEALERSRLEQQAMIEEEVGLNRYPPPDWTYRRELEDLQKKQYWTDEALKSSEGATPSFSLGEPSSLGPSLELLRLSDEPSRIAQENGSWYIDEDDAMREVLMALQGRENVMLQWKQSGSSTGYHITTPMARLRHLSPGSQTSLLESIARTATTVQHLRIFVDDVFKQAGSGDDLDTISVHSAQPSPPTQRKLNKSIRTIEAFADALREEINRFDIWCASQEEAILRAWGGGGSLPGLLCNSSGGRDGVIVSLLSTERGLQDRFERIFQILLAIVKEVLPMQADTTGSFKYRHGSEINFAAATSSYLLDEVLQNAQSLQEQGEDNASMALARVFIHSAEPLWSMALLWLRDGMALQQPAGANSHLQLPDEFFIENSGVGLGIVGMGLLDPEFWREGYTLRDEALFLGTTDSAKGGKRKERNQKSIPYFLEPMIESILRAGKAIGLLRAMGIEVSPPEIPELDCTFQHVIQANEGRDGDETSYPWRISIEELSMNIYDIASPRCNAADALLTEILTSQCAIRDHLRNLEDLFLMRRWDTVSHFADILFTKIDSRQPWTDFHTLNSAFRDVIEANASSPEEGSAQASLVRLSYRGSRHRTENLTVTILDGLVVEYAVPFPLTYVFQPAALQTYSEAFVFLLQARRAKGMLEKVLMKSSDRQNLFKPFYAMRSRLSWFINTFLNFLTTYVIQTLLSDFHIVFAKAKSLDELEEIHTKHSEMIKLYCLLRPQEAALRRTLLSIYDLALHFTDSFIAFAGSSTTTHDLSTSVSIKQHRSRRQRRKAKNIIGFSASMLVDSDSSEEDELDNAVEPSFSYGASVSYEEEDFHARMDRMSSELDGLVKFFRRGVENLGASQDSPLFSVLAFGLDDWDS